MKGIKAVSVQNVSSVNNVNFKGNETNSKVNNTAKPQNNITNGKKKIVLALAALGAAAVAGVAIYKHKNIIKKPIEKTEEITKQTGAKIKGLIKKEELPFDNKDVHITTKSGEKLGVKNTYRKYSAEYKGRDVVVEHKNITANNLDDYYGSSFAVIRDAKTNELVEIKPITLSGNERPIIRRKYEYEANRTKLRLNRKSFDKQGNEVTKTIINRETKAITTIKKNPDGSKEIVVNYGKGGNGNEFGSDNDYKKIITILPDGTKKINKKGRRIFP